MVCCVISKGYCNFACFSIKHKLWVLFRPYFFKTWFTDFFSQNIKVGGGKKRKIKITKNNFFFLI